MNMDTRTGSAGVGATRLRLDPEDLVELDEASTQVKVVGDRYPEAMQQMMNR